MDEKILDIRKFTSVSLNSGWREPFAPQGRNPNINSKAYTHSSRWLLFRHHLEQEMERIVTSWNTSANLVAILQDRLALGETQPEAAQKF
jgi:hypothetical protein